MANIFGKLDQPDTFSGYQEVGQGGISLFLNNLITLLITIAGLITLINFIIAGYLYLSANGNSQKLTQAGTKMQTSLIGLIIIAAAFVISAIIGYIFFGNVGFLLQPQFTKIMPGTGTPSLPGHL